MQIQKKKKKGQVVVFKADLNHQHFLMFSNFNILIKF